MMEDMRGRKMDEGDLQKKGERKRGGGNDEAIE